MIFIMEFYLVINKIKIIMCIGKQIILWIFMLSKRSKIYRYVFFFIYNVDRKKILYINMNVDRRLESVDQKESRREVRVV